MSQSIIYAALLPMLVAMLVVVVVHPSLVRIAQCKRLVDRPNARKVNKTPVPMLGGVGILCGILFGVGLTGCCLPSFDLPAEIIIALVIMLYIGVGDDILDFSPFAKFALQCFVVLLMVLPADICVDTLSGVWGIYYLPRGVAVTLTVFATVGIVNAINLIDGVDGLCALYVMMTSLFFGVHFFAVGDNSYAVMAFAMLGALTPFVLHNMYGRKYKMFLGDGGSLVLGFLCSLFAIRIIQSEAAPHTGNLIAFAFATLSVPVCDTLRVMLSRIADGHSPFRPDKRHLHHILLSLGMTHRAVACSLVLAGVCCVAVWSGCVAADLSAEMQILCVVLSALILTWGTYYLLHYAIRCDAEWIAAIRRRLDVSARNHSSLGRILRSVLNDKT